MKELGKFNLAIKYFKEVAEIESESPTLKTELAQTYVNICSIYSQMNKHEIALQYCQNALKVLEKEYSDQMIATGGKIIPNFIQVIATAYYNCAVEYEYLNEFPESLVYY